MRGHVFHNDSSCTFTVGESYATFPPKDQVSAKQKFFYQKSIN